jgi:hypothetical protein
VVVLTTTFNQYHTTSFMKGERDVQVHLGHCSVDFNNNIIGTIRKSKEGLTVESQCDA